MEKLSIAIGVENYLDAAKKYYVDKTLIIKDLINVVNGGSVVITRPRRFGKSLMLSMLEYFFSIDGDYNFAFKDRLIYEYKDICQKHMNKYPVIHLNMKDIYGNTIDEIYKNLEYKISLIYRKFSFLLDDEKLLDIEKQEFNLVLNKKADQVLLSNSLRNLCGLLRKHYEKKVVFLIDEYDAPIARANEIGKYEECMSILKPLYSNVFKGNDDLFFSVVTGVLQFSKESLFSGLNNPIDASTIDYFLNEYFGFDKEEVQKIIDYYEIDIDVETLAKWYGGYNQINDKELLNPWSIMNYVLNRRLTPYWINTGSNSLLKELIDSNQNVLSVINNTYDNFHFVKEINYRNYNLNSSSLVSFLIQSGYLTLNIEKETNKYNVVIPNHEIELLFENEILNNGLNIDDNLSYRFKTAILNGDVENIKELLEKYILSAFSYFDINNEKDYQNIVSGLLAMTFTTYIVKNEVNVGLGRCDIQLTPKKNNGIGIIIEIKNSNAKVAPSKTNLKKLADNAIKQIEKMNYVEELESRKCSNIILYGFAFYKKNVAISVKENKYQLMF